MLDLASILKAINAKSRELSVWEIEQINKRKLRWQRGSVQVIKEKLENRKKLNFKDDWKIEFYETKLKIKTPIIGKLIKALAKPT